MKTPATDNYPAIEWHELRQELLESDIDERMEVYITLGTGSDGKEYAGTAYFFADVLDEIKNIEEA